MYCHTLVLIRFDSPNFPECLDEAMETRKKKSSIALIAFLKDRAEQKTIKNETVLCLPHTALKNVPFKQ